MCEDTLTHVFVHTVTHSLTHYTIHSQVLPMAPLPRPSQSHYVRLCLPYWFHNVHFYFLVHGFAFVESQCLSCSDLFVSTPHKRTGLYSCTHSRTHVVPSDPLDHVPTHTQIPLVLPLSGPSSSYCARPRPSTSTAL